jgi:hypothetical protein
MKIVEIFTYVMALIGIIITGLTLAAYWMIWISAKTADRKNGEQSSSASDAKADR